MKIRNQLIGVLFFIFLFVICQISCKQPEKEPVTKGKLFIIGGGARPDSLLKRLISESGIDTAGYAVILPMASEEIDSTIIRGKKQFQDRGIQKVYGLNFTINEKPSQQKLDSLRNAKLIYVAGGDQNRFMQVVINSPVYDALKEAFKNGSLIAGTSAGAAMMTKKMITGSERKHSEYTGDFRTIEADNIVIGEGMGFLEGAIIDQHFIKRMRMNRLIATCIENPEEICIGVDESTAILIKKDTAEVIGINQVIVLKNPSKSKNTGKGLLGCKGLELSVYLPGEKFAVKRIRP
jgi:cyanophycinase